MRELSWDQQRALRAMQAGYNVFLSGKAGAGKSTVLHEFVAGLDNQFALLAPTGLAARHIGGDTVHNFFGFPPNVGNLDLLVTESAKRRDNFWNARIVIIDEVSMLNVILFSAIDAVFRKYDCSHLPFGGRQIICVGDFCQLPPVYNSRFILQFAREEFGGIYAFETEPWCQAEFDHIILGDSHRQIGRAHV